MTVVCRGHGQPLMTNGACGCAWLQKRYDFKTVSEIRDFMKGLGSYQTVPFLGLSA